MEDSIELHGFADPSERAFAAVLYLRGRISRSWRTTLLTAKTKVAPIKRVTLPRPELCAAVLLTRLATHLRTTLGLERKPLHCWTDSTVTLGWIKGHPTRWRIYVANRVAEIQTSVPCGITFPAQTIRRTVRLGDYRRAAWWTYIDDQNKELPERRTLTFTMAIAESPEEEPGELLRFSSWHRLLRVTAWCRRWLRLRGNAGATGPASARDEVGDTLSAMELKEPRQLWIRRVQALKFKAELDALRQGRALKGSSKLTSLNPFSDAQGLLRVGGRLKHSLLNWDERHPVILPADSHLIRLVLEACHLRALHGGVQLTLSLVRQLYWVPRGRAPNSEAGDPAVHRLRALAGGHSTTIDGKPPSGTSNSGTPVPQHRRGLRRTDTAADHQGTRAPLVSSIRGHLCLPQHVSRPLRDGFGLHSGRIPCCAAAVRVRRGLCSTIWSDCGTTFVGTDRQLRNLFAASGRGRRRIIDGLASERIQWRFNPPAAPHFGGIWEAAVKSVKHHLRRVLGDTMLTYKEMSTLLAQIEACLNSRPLQALNDDPEDLVALIPGHFLVGSAFTAVPEPSLSDQPDNRISRWQLLQRMRHHFWER